MAWTTPATATAGSTALTAAFWNEQVRDNLLMLAPFMTTWTSYTPQVDQGANTNIAKTVNYAKYLIVNKTVWLNIKMTMSGAGTNAAITITFPSGVTPQYTQGAIGTFYYLDAGSTNNCGAVMEDPDGKMTLIVNGGASAFGVGGPIIANNDIISMACCYEIA